MGYCILIICTSGRSLLWYLFLWYTQSLCVLLTLAFCYYLISDFLAASSSEATWGSEEVYHPSVCRVVHSVLQLFHYASAYVVLRTSFCDFSESQHHWLLIRIPVILIFYIMIDNSYLSMAGCEWLTLRCDYAYFSLGVKISLRCCQEAPLMNFPR